MKSLPPIYDVPCEEKDAKIVYLPVPWEATTSYGGGTADGPLALRKASVQLDLFDSELGRVDQAGLFFKSESKKLRELGMLAKRSAETALKGDASALKKTNELSQELNQWVYQETSSLITREQTVGVIGGDHSIPYGAIKAVAEKERDFGLLHFDAHLDFRKAYQGFEHSHASILNNLLSDLDSITRSVHVGIRDFCEEEIQFAQSQRERVRVFWDQELKRRLYTGDPWDEITKQMIEPLPEKVWVTFDIDGLDPKLCPGTGTPVPGGLDFSQANWILKRLAQSGRKIIGFDLCETGPGEWDANVAMRVLYKLTGWTLLSKKELEHQVAPLGELV